MIFLDVGCHSLSLLYHPFIIHRPLLCPCPLLSLCRTLVFRRDACDDLHLFCHYTDISSLSASTWLDTYHQRETGLKNSISVVSNHRLHHLLRIRSRLVSLVQIPQHLHQTHQLPTGSRSVNLKAFLEQGLQAPLKTALKQSPSDPGALRLSALVPLSTQLLIIHLPP